MSARGPRPVIAIAALLLLAAPLVAQQPQPPTPPPGLPDTAARRPAPPDSVPRDSSDTIRVVPVWPGDAPDGPLPAGTRLVFDQEAIQLSGALTLADLLLRVPGVFVMRGGFFGQPEPIMYAGRGGGPLVLEIHWDGLALDPLGRDSVTQDPARIALGFAERVEIQVEPARLRVDVTSLSHHLLTARSQIRVVTGDDDIAEYRATFEKRWPSGLGVAVGADYRSIERAGRNQSPFSQAGVWLKGEWLPRPTLGVSYQVLTNDVTREASFLVPRRSDRRTDALLRLFARQRPSGAGWWAEALIGSSSVSRDTAVRGVGLRQAALRLGWARPGLAVGVAARARDDRTPFEVEAGARLALLPGARVVVSADAGQGWHEGDRRSRRVHLGGSVALLGGLSLRGDAARTVAVRAPALAGDTAQAATDLWGAVRLDHRWGTVEVGLARRAPWQALAYPEYRAVLDSFNRTPQTTVVAVQATIAPANFLTLAGWYHNPWRGGADFEPPHHFRGSIAFHSKFWRKFRSGAFNLRAEVAAELWSTVTAGRDTLGNARALSGATFVETNLQIQIVGATIFYMIRNSNIMRGRFVPGLEYPLNQRVWGVRWVFTN